MVHVLEISRNYFLIYAILHFEINLQYSTWRKLSNSIYCGYNRTKSLTCIFLFQVLAHTLSTYFLSFPFSPCPSWHFRFLLLLFLLYWWAQKVAVLISLVTSCGFQSVNNTCFHKPLGTSSCCHSWLKMARKFKRKTTTKKSYRSWWIYKLLKEDPYYASRNNDTNSSQ